MLLLVNNYTGDRMAFEMAQELAEAEDIKCATLFIDDDVAVQDSTWTVGRRGVAGNFFVIKAVGAKAEQGADLDEVIRVGEKVNSVARTMGIALTACTPLGQGCAAVRTGRRRDGGRGRHPRRAGTAPGQKKLVSADEIVDELLGAVVPDLPFVAGDRVALMINGLGGTPISELYLLFGIAAQRLADQGITVAAKSYVGEDTAPAWRWPAPR